MNVQSSTFTQGNILSQLNRFTLPILGAILLQSMYGAVDMAVVGYFGDAASVSAIGTGGLIMQAVTGIINGLCMGVTILLAKRIGEESTKGAAKVVGGASAFFVAFSLLFTMAILFFSEPLVTLMRTPPEAFEKTLQYVRLCGCGSISIIGFNLISSILRSTGNSKLPLVLVSIACLINIIGDLILVGLLSLDAAGAAIATVFAQAVSVVAALIILRKRGLPFPFQKKDIRLNRSVSLEILKLGTPIALQESLGILAFLIISAIVNGMGVIASAAVGVAGRVCLFIMMVPIAYTSSISAFVAQNMGANKPDRAKRAMLYGIASSTGIGILMFFLTFYAGHMLASFFSADTNVIAAAAEYLKPYAIDCLILGVLSCYIGYFNGCGKTFFVMLQGLAASFLVRVPICYLMSRQIGVTLFRMALAAPVTTAFSIMLCLFFSTYLIHKNKSFNKSLALKSADH